jgi:hypothetical protein
MKFSRGRLSVFAASFSALAAAFVFSPPAQATPQTINVTIDCTQAVSVTADVGDTIVFTMVHPTCDGKGSAPGNYANFNNLNGTYFNGLGSGYTGTATGSGFLAYVSHTQGTNKATDYWHIHGGQDDWYVMQTASNTSTASVEITTTLLATDGNGAALAVGSVIADIYTEPTARSPIEFLVTYAGPRTSNNSNSSSSSSSPSTSASADSAALASTGQSVSAGLGVAGGAALLLVVGAVLLALHKRSKPE